MQLITAEHDEIMDQFERDFRHMNLTREAKEYWPRRAIYANGETNNAFLAYRTGYAFAKARCQS